MRIKQSAKALSVYEYDTAHDPMSILAYMIEGLRREVPDAETIIIRVEKWEFNDSEGA